MKDLEWVELLLKVPFPVAAFGIDGVFSYLYNHSQGHCDADGLVVCAGHMATHVIPVSKSTSLVKMPAIVFSVKKEAFVCNF